MTDMRAEGYDTGSINKEKLVDAMRSRIRTHRKGGPAYGAESVRRRLSPLKSQSRLAIQYFKKCRQLASGNSTQVPEVGDNSAMFRNEKLSFVS